MFIFGVMAQDGTKKEPIEKVIGEAMAGYEARFGEPAAAVEIHVDNPEVVLHGVEVVRSRYVWMHCALAGRRV